MIETIKAIAWSITTVIILITSIYFTIKLKCPQFRLIKIAKSFKNSTNQEISPIKTLFLTLAGRIGVGSISGVALALYLGGPGTIFWMWIFALLSGVLGYVETMIAIKYKDAKRNIGGPQHYIKKGIKKRALSISYAILVIIAYLIGFIPIQSNTVAKSIESTINTNNLILGIILSLITYIIIKGGIKQITKTTNKIVPIMTILYIIMTIYVIINHLNQIPQLIRTIIKSALNIKPFITGFIPVILIGIQRAIFSNESGIGLGAIAACASQEKNGCKSGYIQTLGIYITTMIICTSTAIIILLFNYQSVMIAEPNGIEITQSAFKYHFGNIGNNLLTISIILFSFSTILTGHYYIETEIKFITKNNNTQLLTIITSLSVLLGCIISPTTIWQIIDIIVAILTIINIYTLYNLRKEIIEYHRKYDII